METHVYLHKNGGFPNIYKDCHPAFIDGEVIIMNRETEEIVYAHDEKEVFRVDVLMETN